MRREIDPQSSLRWRAFELWKNAAMPKVTITKTFNIGRLVKAGRRRGLKTNMLMCWCIGHAANPITEFYTLPAVGHLWQYDCLAVNTVVITAKGEPHLCDIPFSEDIHQFNDDYLRLSRQVHDTNEDYLQGEQYMAIDTSALTCLLPIPPRPDGRLRSRPLPQRPPRGNQQIRYIAVFCLRKRLCGSAV